ncbi:MAG TPA: VIT domain-containing protein [Thermoanaerobaculia bacterium]|jgi:tetratricopeptide (TPR) repeat protein|nr:VIT domain-containing protein [Thermoanaerobaculia bacterium]
MYRAVTLLGLLVLALVGFTGFAVDAAAPASFRFAKPAADEPAAAASTPIRLTASDGTGLSLVALEANGVLEPPLAFTELHLTFENPRDQVIEGRFSISLPPGAALSRFAMKIGDAWQEGEVVETQRARVAYEDFLHRKQDPALLEQEAGNEFSARVFPIPARGRKELIVSYSHALTRAEEPYVLPLLGLSEVGRLDVRVLLGERPAAGSATNLGGEVSDRRMVELHKRDWTPDRDLEIGQNQVGSRTGLRHGNLAVVRVAAPVESVPQEITGLYVLVDSSASRALGYAAQVRRLGELIAGLRDGAGSIPVGIAAFDQEVVPIYEGTAAGYGPAEERRLAGRRPLGASDLHQALSWLSKRAGKHPRVLLITDGVATAGETETRALKAAVRALGAHGVERLDVLAFGGLRDEAVLRELTTGNLPHDGQRVDGAAPLSEIARRLTLACRSGIPVAVEGAAWVWPETLDGVQPGDEALVYADLPAGRPLRLTLGGRPAALGEPVSAERHLLERAWAQARIERLLHLRESGLGNDPDTRRALALQVVEVSVKHRVLSPFTSMLVLETEYDYARFGLDRRSLADILTVGAGGLGVLARTAPVQIPRSSVVAEAPKPAESEVPSARDPWAVLSTVPGVQTDRINVGGNESGQQSNFVGPDDAVEGGVEGGVVGGVVGGVAGGVSDLADRRISTGAAAESLENIPIAEAPLMAERRDRSVISTSEQEKRVAPYSGRFAEVKDLLDAGRIAAARSLAESWSAEAPGDVLALIALGEAWEAAGETAAAARAYGSLIDLFPRRVDLRRLAGERLERLGEAGIGLAIDTYQKAVLERPDHPSGHRLLAWALLRAGRFEEAFAALETGLGQSYPGGRFAGADRVLREDLGLAAAALLHAEPARREEVLGRLEAHGARLETEPSLRFVLTWETDANDVDLHVHDRKGGHAYYSQRSLPSGGELYADVTTGYGPECFTVYGSAAARSAAPYRLGVHYYSRGPMGYGMGTVQVVTHDGEGGLTVEPRPFVVMTDRAMVDVGSVKEGMPTRVSRR